MRMYPPLPLALPRIVPPGGDTVDGYFVPGGVSANEDYHRQRQSLSLKHVIKKLQGPMALQARAMD
ncbi:MAG: hypothetical protein Q9227_000571 [Pyrenula ochraceoflavens]